MNRIFITGNLVRDPELRSTTAGKSVASFTVAVNRRKKIEGQPDADYFRVAAWEGLGESCAKYLAKGRKVAVTGSISLSTYTTQEGQTRANLEVRADDVEFLTPRSEGGSNEAQPPPAKQGFTEVGAEAVDLPF